MYSFVKLTTTRRALSSSAFRAAKADNELNSVSKHITQPKSQGASQAMLYATGMSEDDMNKAQVGISSVWYSGNPCNMQSCQQAKQSKFPAQLELIEPNILIALT
jgi:dihydroxyacid dehydratase/phosphogluconate dehydratase